MRISFSFFGATVLILTLQPFTQPYIINYELKQNEVIKFNDGPESKIENYRGWFRRGAYDSSRYVINIDTLGNLKVGELRGSTRLYQNEINLYHSIGTINRYGDTLKIQAKTIYKKLYIFNLETNGILDSLSADIQIDLVSRTP